MSRSTLPTLESRQNLKRQPYIRARVGIGTPVVSTDATATGKLVVGFINAGAFGTRAGSEWRVALDVGIHVLSHAAGLVAAAKAGDDHFRLTVSGLVGPGRGPI